MERKCRKHAMAGSHEIIKIFSSTSIEFSQPQSILINLFFQDPNDAEINVGAIKSEEISLELFTPQPRAGLYIFYLYPRTFFIIMIRFSLHRHAGGRVHKLPPVQELLKLYN